MEGRNHQKKSLEIFRASQSSRMRWMSRMNRDYRENHRKLPKKCQRTLSDSRSSAGLRAKELLCFCTWWDLKLGWCPPNGPRDWETLQESWDLGKIWVLFPLMDAEIYLEPLSIIQTIQNQSTMQIHPTVLPMTFSKMWRNMKKGNYANSCTSLSQTQYCLQYAPPGKLVWSGVQKQDHSDAVSARNKLAKSFPWESHNHKAYLA